MYHSCVLVEIRRQKEQLPVDFLLNQWQSFDSKRERSFSDQSSRLQLVICVGRCFVSMMSPSEMENNSEENLVKGTTQQHLNVLMSFILPAVICKGNRDTVT